MASTIGKECPKCGHIRQAGDQGPAGMCPKCKAVYSTTGTGTTTSSQAPDSTANTLPFLPSTPTLTSCADCGKPISLRASTCPHCGAPQHASPAVVQREISFIWTLLFGWLYFFARGWIKAGLVALLLCFLTGFLAWFIIPFFRYKFVEALEGPPPQK